MIISKWISHYLKNGVTTGRDIFLKTHLVHHAASSSLFIESSPKKVHKIINELSFYLIVDMVQIKQNTDIYLVT